LPPHRREALQSTIARTIVDVGAGVTFAKCPRWIGEKLLFLDIHDRSIKSTDLAGNVRKVRELPYLPGSLDVREDGRLIVSDALHSMLYQFESDAAFPIADLSKIARCRLGESVVDYRGGVYIGDVGFDFLNPLVDPISNGVLIYLGADGNPFVVADNLFYPSGMTITPDNSTLIVSESLGHRLTCFDIENDGSLRNRRVWAQFEDDVKPNGICIDTEGAVWVTGIGPGARLVKEGGEIAQQIKTKRPVYAAALGGPDRKHLFMCTSVSSDPIMIRQFPAATIDVAEVGSPASNL
jgi:sugar lactone lactonase YvrE